MASSDGADIPSRQNAFPIQSLQPEILSQIFTFHFLDSFDRFKRVKRAILTLCNVCSSWRDIAIATPCLWTIFHLFIHRYTLENYGIDTIVEHIGTWLGRSGTRPLTIDFSCYRGAPARETIQACEALAVYTSRWETVMIDTGNSFGSLANLGEVPLLQTLYVNQKLDSIPFSSAPRLTNLVVSMSPSPDIIALPWHQLTHLGIWSGVHGNIVLVLLQSCSFLESLDTGIVEPEEGVVLPYIPRMKHAALRILSLTLFSDCGTFLESLILPALSSLVLVDYEKQSPYLTVLVDLFNRSHCELEHVAFTDLAFTSSGLLTILGEKSCRTLTNLVITNSIDSLQRTSVDDEVLKRLTYVDSDGEATWLCPNLFKLSLCRCYSKDSSPGVLGRMILSRCSKERPLSVFSLWTSSDISEEDKNLLELAKERSEMWITKEFSYSDVDSGPVPTATW